MKRKPKFIVVPGNPAGKSLITRNTRMFVPSGEITGLSTVQVKSFGGERPDRMEIVVHLHPDEVVFQDRAPPRRAK